jgi:hypothetical protein
MCFTATEWPGGALISRVVRPWRQGGDWHACWNETRDAHPGDRGMKSTALSTELRARG